MTLEEFAAAHAGVHFQTWDDFADAVWNCGLNDADRQGAYSAWRQEWMRQFTGCDVVVQRQPGKPKWG